MSTPDRRYVVAWVVTLLFLCLPLLLWAFPSNPPLGNTSAPGEGNCSSCHGGGAGGGNVRIAFSGGGTTYTPGTAQTLTVTVSDPNGSSAYGFELTALEGSTSLVTPGTFAAVSSNVSAPATSGSKIYERQSSSASNTFSFTWTPPASSVYSGPVVFYVASLAGNGSQGAADSLYQTNTTLTAAGGGTTLSASPTSLSFSYTQNGTVPAARSVSVTSSGAVLSYTVATSTTSGGSWLSATPASSTTPGTESVSVNPTGLAPGTYNGTVTVTSSGASNSPLSVPVTLTVAAQPNLTVSPSSLTFNFQIGGTAPASQTVSVGSTGAALSYTVTSSTVSGGSWLSATPASSTTPGTETVSVNTSGLAAGTYTGTVRIAATSAGNSPQAVGVTLNVTSAPNLTVSPSSLTFNFQIGGTAPASQTVSVGSTGAALNYTVTTSTNSGGNWLSPTPTSGTTPRTETVSVSTTGLAAGTYTGRVSIASTSAGNSPQAVGVTLNVTTTPPPPPTFSLSGNVSANGSGASVNLSGPMTSQTTADSSGNFTFVSLVAGTYTVTPTKAGFTFSPTSQSATISSSNVTNVNFTASPVAVTGLTVTPTQLSFQAVVGSEPPTQTLSVTSSTATSFRATAFVQSGTGSCTNWLSIVPSGSSTTNQTITVTANSSGLSPGNYSGAVEITSGGGEGSTPTTVILVPVTLRISSAFMVTPTRLNFSAAVGGSAPPSQTFTVTDTLGATPFTASASTSSGGSWLTINPSGNLTTNQTITVSANPGVLVAGTYNGTVSLATTGTTVRVSVVLTVGTSGTPEFALVGWNDLGMHCDDGQDYSVFGLLPPYNTIHAQLIDLTGNLIVNPSGFTITYQGTHDPLTNTINTISSPKTNWWQFVSQLVTPLGFPAPALDVGLAPAGSTGFAMPGSGNTPRAMAFSTSDNTWVAAGVPVVPYGDAASPPFPHNDYPMMQLVAKNAAGATLATTSIVVPVSDDIGCAACHGSGSGDVAAMPASGWSNLSDPNKDYKHNILKKHDDRFATSSLFQTAAAAVGYSSAGLEATTATKPVLCINCHAEVFLGLPGQPNIQPFSRAIHGLHASQIDPATNQPLDAATTRAACYRCHPGSTSQCLRGVMGNLTDATGAHLIECQSCHGNLSNLATSTRKPWFDEPNCQACHTGTAVSNSGQIVYTTVFSSGTTMRAAADQTFASNPNTPATGESLFRFSSGHGGLQCESCHGSTHAEFPTSNVNDNVQSMNLQGHTGVLVECTTCHATVPSTVSGGPHGMHPVGSSWVSTHPSVVTSSGSAQCQVCHGTDYRGTTLTRALADRALAGLSFPAGTIIGCYSCHNGPGG
jgi:hypothetical protein